MSAIYSRENSKNGGYQPASYMGTVRSSRTSAKRPSTTKPSEIRDLLATIDGLKRDLGRKDVRCEGLVKELASVRSIAVSTTREIKILRDTYDKLNQEKQGLQQEIERRRDKESKMEGQLSRMENAHQVLMQNQTLRAEIDSLKRQARSSSSALSLKVIRNPTLTATPSLIFNAHPNPDANAHRMSKSAT